MRARDGIGAVAYRKFPDPFALGTGRGHNDGVSRLRWVKALELGELEDNECRALDLGDRQICISRVAGRFGAIDDYCPHRGASLGAGRIVDGYVECPIHAWHFDPSTGTLRGGYPCGLSSYRVEPRTDGLYVGLPAERALHRDANE